MTEVKKLRDQLSSSIYPPVPPNWGADFTKTTRYDTYPYIDPTARPSCHGKAVLITAGNKGIGLGVAIAYAKAGASHIAITSRTSDTSCCIAEIRKAAQDAGRSDAPEIVALTMDVTDGASVKSAALEVEARFGRLDVLVENAGFLAHYDKILDGDEEEWWTSFDVNLRGGYLVAKAFLPLLLKGGDKTIIFMSSTGALHFHSGGSSYQISKFALLRLVEFLMAEYADQVLFFFLFVLI